MKTLDLCEEKKRIRIISNPDLKTVELGLHSNSLIRVVSNQKGQGVIVQIYEQRYAIPRAIAREIEVK